jgi:uncharacterized membrane protein YdjX (TVP38/TMEM64 family)
VTAAGFVKRFGLLLVVGALLAAALATGAWRWVSLESLRAHHAQLQAFVARDPALSVVAFFGAFVAVITACVPGPGLVMIASGYLFGPWLGGIISLSACVAGSTVVFLACRSAFAETIARRSGPRIRQLELALAKDAFSYLTTLKLIPVVPFFVANVAAGLAGVRLSAVVASTLLGSAPVCFVLASLGSGLGRLLDGGGPLSARLLQRPEVILPLLGLSVLAVVSVALRTLARRRS